MSDCCSAPGLIPLEKAQALLQQHITPIKEVFDCSLEESLGFTLADSVVSPVSVPPYDNASMDGYAVRLSELASEKVLPVAGASFAGHPFKGTMPEEHCVRIMTGACIPEGADSVIMQEHAEKTPNGIQFTQWPDAIGASIRLTGDDIQRGTCIFKQGHKIKTQDIGLLASLGVPTVPVFRRLKAAVFSTGDELRQPGETLRDGEIYDSNRFAIKGMLSKMNVEVIDFGCIPDDRHRIRDALSQANEQADVVITSGGVSVGDADYTRDVLDEMGETTFWKIAIKPGKPFTFGQLSGSVFFGLPGNPVSALVTFQQLTAPALRAMMNMTAPPKRAIQAVCQTPLKKYPGRKEFQRGVWGITDSGQVTVSTTGSQSSGILHSMSMADCYIVLPEDNDGVDAGDNVTIELFDELLI